MIIISNEDSGPIKDSLRRVVNLVKELHKSLSSAPGQGGDLIVPMMGSSVHRGGMVPFPRQKPIKKPEDESVKKSKKMRKSRPAKRKELFRGLPINIEIDVGDVKQGVDPDGKPWAVKYEFPYGEIAGTTALSDGDPVDIYRGPDETSDVVFVVHQLDISGNFDEDKSFIGFGDDPYQIAQIYLDHGPDFGLGSMERMTWDQFIHGYLASNRQDGWLIRWD